MLKRAVQVNICEIAKPLKKGCIKNQHKHIGGHIGSQERTALGTGKVRVSVGPVRKGCHAEASEGAKKLATPASIVGKVYLFS